MLDGKGEEFGIADGVIPGTDGMTEEVCSRLSAKRTPAKLASG